MAFPLHAETRAAGDKLLLDGKPFFVKGAAGQDQLPLLKGLGANTIRTYGDQGKALLDQAQRLGLKVALGFWLEHPRRGFDYRNRVAVDAQLKRFEAFVLEHRNHPALLLWGIGNEVEADLGDDSLVWPAIEEAAALAKRLDPHHARMAVLAEAGGDKIRRLIKAAPSVDVLGVNSYGDGLLSLPERVRGQGWMGPLIVSELGPLGQWQAAKMPWGAAIEPDSGEKAARLQRYLGALQQNTAGHFVFYWGQKQEVTPTWHSLLGKDGAWNETAETLARAWGGDTPRANRAPRIRRFELIGNARAELRAEDPDGDPLTVEWDLRPESTDLQKYGDPEREPAPMPASLGNPGLSGVALQGIKPGNYRLFVTLRDGRGAVAQANRPFQVN